MWMLWPVAGETQGGLSGPLVAVQKSACSPAVWKVGGVGGGKCCERVDQNRRADRHVQRLHGAGTRDGHDGFARLEGFLRDAGFLIAQDQREGAIRQR